MTNNTFSHIPTDNEVLCKIREQLDSFLSDKRLEHTLSVEKEAQNIAGLLFPYLGIDKKYLSDISAAALLHDITKYYSKDKHMKICEKYSIYGKGDLLPSDAVLHSRTGAFEAAELFGINDIVREAVFCHTTGKENMNIFDKIIFTADYIEHTRTHESCRTARSFFYDNIYSFDDKMKVLDGTIIMALDFTIQYLVEKGEVIDMETVKARNFLLAEYALRS